MRKPKKRMTKRELALAQFLVGTLHRANQIADELDPERNRSKPDKRKFPNCDRDTVGEIDRIGAVAFRALLKLTGRVVISEHELNTEHPAEWTKGEG